VHAGGVEARTPFVVHHAPLGTVDPDGRVCGLGDHSADLVAHVRLVAYRIIDEVLRIADPVVVVNAEVVEIPGRLVQQFLVPAVAAAFTVIVAVATASIAVFGSSSWSSPVVQLRQSARRFCSTFTTGRNVTVFGAGRFIVTWEEGDQPHEREKRRPA
jgi:hypothetical protein